MLLGTEYNTLTISGYTPVELATGRNPTDHADLELVKPDQLSAVDLPRDAALAELKKLALRAHLEARQSADLRRDLARRILLSDCPYAHGDRVLTLVSPRSRSQRHGMSRVPSKNRFTLLWPRWPQQVWLAGPSALEWTHCQLVDWGWVGLVGGCDLVQVVPDSRLDGWHPMAAEQHALGTSAPP